MTIRKRAQKRIMVSGQKRQRSLKRPVRADCVMFAKTGNHRRSVVKFKICDEGRTGIVPGQCQLDNIGQSGLDKRTVEMLDNEKRKLNSKSESLNATEANNRDDPPNSYSNAPDNVENIVYTLLHCNQVMRGFSKSPRGDLELLINVTQNQKRPKVVLTLSGKHLKPKTPAFEHDPRCPCKGQRPPSERSVSAKSIAISEIPTAQEISKEDYAPRHLVAEIRSLNIE